MCKDFVSVTNRVIVPYSMYLYWYWTKQNNSILSVLFWKNKTRIAAIIFSPSMFLHEYCNLFICEKKYTLKYSFFKRMIIHTTIVVRRLAFSFRIQLTSEQDMIAWYSSIWCRAQARKTRLKKWWRRLHTTWVCEIPVSKHNLATVRKRITVCLW